MTIIKQEKFVCPKCKSKNLSIFRNSFYENIQYESILEVSCDKCNYSVFIVSKKEYSLVPFEEFMSLRGWRDFSIENKNVKIIKKYNINFKKDDRSPYCRRCKRLLFYHPEMKVWKIETIVFDKYQSFTILCDKCYQFISKNGNKKSHHRKKED